MSIKANGARFFFFFHPDYTVGIGISPNPALRLADCHCRWGVTPRPEDTFILFWREIFLVRNSHDMRIPTAQSTVGIRFSLNCCYRERDYCMISVTTPEPTVLPPSRIAKRRPFSIAIGVMSSTVISTLSPGRHISTPSGRLMIPVTSVVRK